MASAINPLLQRNDIWLGKQWQQGAVGIATGFAALDKQLAGQGWPQVGVVELIGDTLGVAALLQPLLNRQQQPDRWQLCVAPPAAPNGAGWAQAGIDLSRLLWVDTPCRKEQLWSIEHSLSSGRCSVVLAWLTELSAGEARRLQLAAQQGQCLLLLHLPKAALAQAHGVSLRLQVTPSPQGCVVQLLKQRGGWPQAPLALPLPGRPDPSSDPSSGAAAVVAGPWLAQAQ
ncbi:translesion DNA synthesis-associated protein ImuA [Ferrimonas senticii]|uniref:translesion DNA synthesis-associated protein ImuA n=1 Tax=Ferrimonas senticii TaxID=394566 RepID=UPI0004084E20|nr:translesion DNA synthesis-associated protein ImuA [Ferrimonas senticii]